jgi:RimJ/RimL family protein N-acetyltransferase
MIKGSGLIFPDDWPSEDVMEILPEYFQKLEKDDSEYGWGIWLVILRNEKRVIGDVGFKGKPDTDGNVEIGYSILPAYRRRGYAYEAVKALLKYALLRHDIKVVKADCKKDNIPSIKILEKLGMRLVEEQNGLTKWEFRKPVK